MNESLIDHLRTLVPPPRSPVYNMGDWEAAEKDLGIQMPQSYKDCIDIYGQGMFIGAAFRSGLLITSYLRPSGANQWANGFGSLFHSFGTIPYGVYPNDPGLLGFGSYADKDTIAWDATIRTDMWSIVYHDPETGFHNLGELNFIQFVISILEESSYLHESGVIKMGNMKGPHHFRPEP